MTDNDSISLYRFFPIPFPHSPTTEGSCPQLIVTTGTIRISVPIYKYLTDAAPFLAFFISRWDIGIPFSFVSYTYTITTHTDKNGEDNH